MSTPWTITENAGEWTIRRDDHVYALCNDEKTAVRIWAALLTQWAATPSGANAPYKIVKKGGKFAVVNNTGDTKASFDDRDKALAYLRALYTNVPGAAKRADKVKFTGKAKDRAAEK